MNDLKNLIEKGKSHLRQYLEENGVKIVKKGSNDLFCCINPDHDDHNPSAGFVKAADDLQFHCFSCLEENQLVWTDKGLKPIKALHKGDTVITHDGTYSTILNTRTAVKNVMEIRTGSFRDPIVLTHDHPVLVLKKDNVTASLSCVREEKTRELKFYGKFKDSTKRNAKQLEITTVRADEVTTSDFLLFPTSTFNQVFKNPSIKRPIKTYTSGPKTERVWELSVTKELARLYGLYVAEGSSFRGGIKFSFHIKEKDTLAKFTKETIEAAFGRRASIYTSKKAKSCEVTCSCTDLEYQFEAAFGDGAKNKQIPTEIFDWEDRYKKAFLTGYLEGDGCKGHLAVTISKQLAYGLYRLGVDLHRNPSLSEMVGAYTDSLGTNHSDCWSIRFCKEERLDGFYTTIDNTEYFISKISSIRDEGTIANVVDIEVDQQHTFLSAMGAMHNCGISGDVYTAAALLEAKPMHGIGFIKDNVEYILKRYGVEFEPVELTDEQLSRIKYEAVYETAFNLMTYVDRETGKLKYNDLTHAKARGWEREICMKLGVGSVKNFDEYVKAISTSTRLDTETIKKMGIRDDLFGPDLITFCVKDHTGIVRGFATRYVKWTKGCDVPKYRNTSITDNPFYHKDRLLFCLDRAKHYNGLRLDIFEGYGSGVTAQQAGLHSSCAIGGTALTDNHVDIIRSLQFNHINLVLDQDITGSQHMEKYIEKFAGYPGLKITITHLPISEEDKKVPGQNDPDFFIQRYGINEYRKIKPIGVFQHMLQKAKGTLDPVSSDISCVTFARKMLPLIINESDLIERGRMITVLAQETGVDKDDLKAEVERLEKSDSDKIKNDLVNKLKRANRADDIKDLIDHASDQLENSTATKKDKYLVSVGETIEVFDEIFVEMNAHKEGIHGWLTGYTALDNMIDGIPRPTARAGRALGFAGFSQAGKSAIQLNLALQVATRNKDVTVCYWAIDDNRKTIAYRLVSMISQVPVKRIINIQPRIGDDSKKIKEAQDLIRELTASQKLVFKDDRYGRNRQRADDWIKATQDTSGNPILFCIDSLHNVTGSDDADTRVKLMGSSTWAKSLCATVPCTVMMTMELVKNRVAGQKPTLNSISESGKLEYDMDMIGIVWNEAAGSFTSVENVAQKWGVPGAWKPIIELDIQKNKTGAGERGSIYFRYDPTTTSLVDCSSFLDGHAVEEVKSSSGNTYQFPTSNGIKKQVTSTERF